MHRIGSPLVVGVFLWMSCADDVPTPPPPPPPPPVAPVAPIAPIVPAPAPPPVPEPAPPVVPDASVVDEASTAATKEIVVVGPASLTWKGIGNKRGDTKITVRASAVNVVALDPKHASTHTIPIVDGVADFNALPKGELVVRASPQAALFLANESIGTTPPAKPVTLPVGDYTVKLVFRDKVKTARVKVTAGAKAEIHMKMTE